MKELLFRAVNTLDLTESFTIYAISELAAKLILMEKLGYDIIHNDNQTIFFLVNLETPDTNHVPLNANTFESALNEVLNGSNWGIEFEDFFVDPENDGEL